MKMGKVAVTYKVMPCSADEEIDKIKSEIIEKIKPQDIKVEPLAFGLKAIKLMVVSEDAQQNIEEMLRKIKGVGEIEIESTTLL